MSDTQESPQQYQEEQPPPLRRSPRLQKALEVHQAKLQLSSWPMDGKHQKPEKKRKRLLDVETSLLSSSESEQSSEESLNSSESEPDVILYSIELSKHNIFGSRACLMDGESKMLCKEYLKGDRQNVKTSVFTPAQFAEVLSHAECFDEPRLVRDVTPWIVPSAEVLWFQGELKIDYIADGFCQEWEDCALMGGIRPKPAYTAGLQRSAFTKKEIAKLETYAAPDQPVWFTFLLSFPFLVCEARVGKYGFPESDRLSLHSASIAVRAIFALYEKAYDQTAPQRVQELYGKVLAFSISHDHESVHINGHYATTKPITAYTPRRPSAPNALKFLHQRFSTQTLDFDDGEDRFTAYNFVLNLYEKFAPEHRKRIIDAVAHLPVPSKRASKALKRQKISQPGPERMISEKQEHLKEEKRHGEQQLADEKRRAAQTLELERRKWNIEIEGLKKSNARHQKFIEQIQDVNNNELAWQEKMRLEQQE
ncbi:MAG: hypothetical protein M1829_002305 [Trizodia sp. TS-e1964]|nr:MAG: hypothetical protein M1829_002305 [Trizodia sp. TS-e1964]